MPPSLTSPLRLLLGLGLCVLLWGASLAAVHWDLQRRRRPRAEMVGWLALTALLPGVGLLAYLLTRALNHFFPLADGSAGPGVRRLTLLRPPPAPAPRTGTIAASELVKETLFDRRRVPPAAPAVFAPPAPEPPAPAVSLLLAVVAGPHAGQEFEITTLPARLGRGGAATLRLDRDLGISREQAEFYFLAGTLHICDLHSQHGTSVNGRRIEDQSLHPGDRIEIGLSALIVKRVGA